MKCHPGEGELRERWNDESIHDSIGSRRTVRTGLNTPLTAPSVLGKNISFNNVITIGMMCGGEFKFFSVDHVTDPESLKTFEELDQENSNNSISEVL